ncbi:SDR family oxidoreductase [Maricurvus nonylphenolicus]|uniref:SDR family NAD(P)-dependent oxidoreductase n=1 Tax=Maricurvus nonylphenolicus TaxID=1008307 RepID=UPI0036F44449
MSKNILELNGRVALVTGAGQGVGRQIAMDLGTAENSGGVAVNDYFLDRAEAVAEEIRQAGGKAVAVQADVTNLDSVKEMVAKTKESLGPVATLVNNAGNMGATPTADVWKPFWETGPEVWSQTINVNLFGVINCAAAVVPGIIETGAPGRVITIMSDAGRVGDSGVQTYAAAKAGAAGFMRSLARDLGRFQINCNTISIAATNTPAIAQVLENEQMLKKMMSAYVIRRVGEPSDISNMALFLASEASSWITGQTYPVNGGYSFSL